MDELKSILSAKYDFVCSVGSDCGCAWHLGSNKLRTASYPFDWIGTWNIGLSGTARLVADDFTGFLQLANLRKSEMQSADNVHSGRKYLFYDDVRWNIIVAHDFPADCPVAETYPAVRAKYDRRIKRFYETVRQAKTVLFVRWSWREHPDEDDIRRAREILQEKFPEQRVDLLVMRNADVPELRPEILGDGVFVIDGAFHPAGGHPAYGDLELNRKVFSRIRLRGKRRRILREWFAHARMKFVSAFIFNREKRHAYRERHDV